MRVISLLKKEQLHRIVCVLVVVRGGVPSSSAGRRRRFAFIQNLDMNVDEVKAFVSSLGEIRKTEAHQDVRIKKTCRR
jgi:hypothetical protein